MRSPLPLILSRKFSLSSFFVISIFVLNGCAAYPKAIEDKDNERCDLTSKYLDLEVTKPLPGCAINPFCIVISGGTLIYTAMLSGSVVLVGNTVHFLEKQGKCEDSFLNASILQHNEPLLKQNGTLVELPIH